MDGGCSGREGMIGVIAKTLRCGPAGRPRMPVCARATSLLVLAALAVSVCVPVSVRTAGADDGETYLNTLDVCNLKGTSCTPYGQIPCICPSADTLPVPAHCGLCGDGPCMLLPQIPSFRLERPPQA